MLYKLPAVCSSGWSRPAKRNKAIYLNFLVRPINETLGRSQTVCQVKKTDKEDLFKHIRRNLKENSNGLEFKGSAKLFHI